MSIIYKIHSLKLTYPLKSILGRWHFLLGTAYFQGQIQRGYITNDAAKNHGKNFPQPTVTRVTGDSCWKFHPFHPLSACCRCDCASGCGSVCDFACRFLGGELERKTKRTASRIATGIVAYELSKRPLIYQLFGLGYTGKKWIFYTIYIYILIYS